MEPEIVGRFRDALATGNPEIVIQLARQVDKEHQAALSERINYWDKHYHRCERERDEAREKLAQVAEALAPWVHTNASTEPMEHAEERIKVALAALGDHE